MKLGIKFLLFCFLVLACFENTLAQKENKYTFSNKIVDINIGYNYQIPQADLSNRFGNFNTLYFGASIKTRSHWFMAAEVNYMFGPEIKELNILNNVSNSSGVINDINGNSAKYSVGMRGYGFYGRFGRVIPVSKYNKNSGILAMLGGGYMWHWINFNIPQDNIAQLNENYQKGYDRLTAGYAGNLFLGYIVHTQKRLVNFYLGVDFTTAITQSVRGYNYDEMKYDNSIRTDQITALRFGWLIPIYLNTKDENEFDFK